MSADDIIKIIERLPEYLQLVYPGYITIYLYCFFRAFTIKDSKTTILKAIILSYIYNVVFNQISNLIFISGRLNYIFVENIALTLIAAIVAYISFWITKSRKIESILKRLKISTTFSSNEIEEMEKCSDDGTWLVIYMKDNDIVYEGFLVSKEMEPDKKQYIAITKYRKYFLSADGKPTKPYIDDYSNNDKEKAVLYLDKISHFEIRDTSVKAKEKIINKTENKESA